MALHPHALATREKPRPPRVAAVLDRQPAPARRAPLPIPGRPLSQRPQRLQKRPATFYNVHGLGDSLCGFSINHSMVARPIFVKVPAALPHQHNLEPSQVFHARTLEESRREKKLLDQVRDAIRTKHYSIRTEEAYVELGAALHLIPRQAPPERHGRPGDRGVSYPSGRRRPRLRLHPEPGPQRAALPLSRRCWSRICPTPSTLSAPRPSTCPPCSPKTRRALIAQLVGHLSADGQVALRFRPAPPGMPAPARQGPRLRPSANHRARR